ncbi:hypothetical protein VTI74DRAFT_1546 [Chaetomium olivicolor]
MVSTTAQRHSFTHHDGFLRRRRRQCRLRRESSIKRAATPIDCRGLRSRFPPGTLERVEQISWHAHVVERCLAEAAEEERQAEYEVGADEERVQSVFDCVAGCLCFVGVSDGGCGEGGEDGGNGGFFGVVDAGDRGAGGGHFFMREVWCCVGRERGFGVIARGGGIALGEDSGGQEARTTFAGWLGEREAKNYEGEMLG